MSGRGLVDQQPVGQALKAKAQLLVFQFLDDAAIGDGHFQRQSPREGRTDGEACAHGFSWIEQDEPQRKPTK
jgi:hypothetical protein